MKKSLIIPILFCFLLQSSNIYAYELTAADAAIVSRATTKLEKMIKVKGEVYRNIIIRMLSNAMSKIKSNSRTYALVSKTVKNLQPKSVQKKPTFSLGTASINNTSNTNKATTSKVEPNYDSDVSDESSSSTSSPSGTTATNPTTPQKSVKVQSWDANLLYEAISGGKTSKDIKNGSVKFDSTTLNQTMVMSAINKVRSNYGLPPLVFNETLATVAKNHSTYMSINGISEGHSETSEKKGFTGQSPLDRAKTAGYKEGSAGENISYHKGDIVASLRELLYVPYHRTNFLEDWRDIGFCLEKDCYGVFNFGGENTSQVSHFVYPKSGSNIYNYTDLIGENPNPFPGLSLKGFVVSIWDSEGVEKDSIRFVDVTEDKNISITFASAFSPACTVGGDGISITVNETSQQHSSPISRTSSTTHFINREPLKEGHTYMTEYSTTNVGDNVCKIRRSYFVAGAGVILDSSKLLPTESSQCGNVAPKVQDSSAGTSESTESVSEAGAIDVTGDVYMISQKYDNTPEYQVYSYTDEDKKRDYVLSFSDSDMAWLLAKKESTGQASPNSNITGMYVVKNVHFKIFDTRKMDSMGGSSSDFGYESYNASARVVK